MNPSPPFEPRRVVTLLTDFGERDHYVASMKGVMLAVALDLSLVDLSHQIAPHDVVAAAWFARNAYSLFPAGVVHLAVIDPGVGSDRRGIAVRQAGSLFVGPDNGLFTNVITAPDAECREIEVARHVGELRSATFHGRDVFAPVAARLAAGQLAFEEVGPAIADARCLPAAEPQREGATDRGHVVDVDRFGNLITNIAVDTGRNAAVLVGGRRIPSLSRTYADVPVDRLLALVGSCGTIEVSVRDGSAAQRLGVERGADVAVEWRDERDV